MGRGNAVRWLPSGRKALTRLAVLAVVLLAGGALYRAFAPPSPEAVSRTALAAVDRLDARELLRLTDPEELRRLNLTEASVSAMLRETLWRDCCPRVAASPVRRAPDMPADRATFPVTAAGVARPDGPTLYVAATDSLDRGWRLHLSFLFYSYCRQRAGSESAGRAAYVQLCRRHGVTGMQDPRGEYHSLEQIERRAREFAAEGR
ncbi:MAG: hypothetical protein IT208_10720 [Chthonomonadales bacterium]|nr:hypothetical protein [Chthonomonadales bacterium]